MVLVDQSAKYRFAMDAACWGREGDHVRFVTERPQLHPVALLAAAVVVVVDVSPKDPAEVESADNLCDLLILVEEASGAVTASDPEFVEIDHFVGQWA